MLWAKMFICLLYSLGLLTLISFDLLFSYDDLFLNIYFKRLIIEGLLALRIISMIFLKLSLQLLNL